MPSRSRPEPTNANGEGHAFAEERRRRILQLLSERGRIRNTELAELLGVTEPTVRKDVSDLARQQQLRRTHGGIIALRPSFEPNLPERMSTNAAAKSRIAHTCVEMINNSDAVFLDAGSTVLRIAELLTQGGGLEPRPKNVNILTNALPVAQTVAGESEIRHTVLGGTYRPAGACFVGPLTLADLADFSVNIAFIGVTGLTDHGFTVADLAEAQVKRAVVERARRTIVAMDRSKLGASDFAKVCDLGDVTAVVTDESTTYLDELCHDAGVEVIVAG